MIIWHNGTFKNDHEFHFHLNDRVRYGDGVFDTMLAVDGTLIWPELHLQRLFDAAALLRIPIPYGEEDFTSAAQDLLPINNLSGQAIINIIVSRGSGPRRLMPPADAETEIIVMASATPIDYASVHAIISKTTRRNEGSPLSQYKTFNYGDSILALTEAKKANANEAVLLNNQGFVAGVSAGNIYILQNNVLYTPPLTDGAVGGIVRKQLLIQGYAQEKSLVPADLMAHPVFISNSVRGVFPVMKLDGQTLPLANLPFDAHFHTKINI